MITSECTTKDMADMADMAIQNLLANPHEEVVTE
jgi:hypothetical protein